MIQQTTPEEMSVSKEPPPSKQPSKAAQTGTDKLTVEVTDTTIEKTNSGRIVKPSPKLINFLIFFLNLDLLTHVELTDFDSLELVVTLSHIFNIYLFN